MLSLDLTVRTYGWQLNQITDDHPWSYTIGLLESYDHPELMVTGLDFEMQNIVIRKIVDAIEKTGSVDHAFLERERVTLVEVHSNHLAGDWFGTWSNFYEQRRRPGRSCRSFRHPTGSAAATGTRCRASICRARSTSTIEPADASDVANGERAPGPNCPLVNRWRPHHYGGPMSVDPQDRTSLPVEFLGTFVASTQAVAPVAVAGPSGTRLTVTVTGGTFSGPKINGALVEGAAGGDWPLVRADGTLVLDVRANLRTDDGADIYVTYSGIGVPGADGGYSIRTAPLFQTGDERYAWLNNVQALGIGRTTDAGVEYDIYAVQ